MREEQFVSLFTELCAAFGKDFNKPQMLVYFKYLGDRRYEDFKRAVELVIISGGNYFPTIAELNEKMDPGEVGESWQKVVEIAAGGCREWRKLTDIEIATVSSIGGMADIQNATEQSLHFIFQQFQKAFPIMQRRGIKLNSDSERLKILNMVPETYYFLLKLEGLKELPIMMDQPKQLKDMLSQIGGKI